MVRLLNNAYYLMTSENNNVYVYHRKKNHEEILWFLGEKRSFRNRQGFRQKLYFFDNEASTAQKLISKIISLNIN